jgi:hypothetical protein
MPSHVKRFFGLTIAVIVYWMLSTVSFGIRIALPVVFSNYVDRSQYRECVVHRSDYIVAITQ